MFFILKTLFVHYEKMFEFSSVCRLLMKSLNKRPENNFNVVIFRANRHKEREWEGWEQMLPLLLWFWNCESQNFISRDRRRFPNNFQSIWMSNIAQIQNLIAISTVDFISQTLPECDVTIWIDMITSTCYVRLQSHNTMNITIEILQYCLLLSIEILSHVELKSETKISFWLECVEIIKISILQCHTCVWAWYLWVFTLTVMIFALRLSSYRVSDEIILK